LVWPGHWMSRGSVLQFTLFREPCVTSGSPFKSYMCCLQQLFFQSLLDPRTPFVDLQDSGRAGSLCPQPSVFRLISAWGLLGGDQRLSSLCPWGSGLSWGDAMPRSGKLGHVTVWWGVGSQRPILQGLGRHGLQGRGCRHECAPLPTAHELQAAQVVVSPTRCWQPQHYDASAPPALLGVGSFSVHSHWICTWHPERGDGVGKGPGLPLPRKFRTRSPGGLWARHPPLPERHQQEWISESSETQGVPLGEEG
jgi:hypothetical protein